MEVAVESLPKVGSYIDGRSRIVNSKYLPPALEYFGNGQAIQTSSDQHARTSFGQQQSSSKSSQLSQAYRIEIDSKELSCSKCSQLYTECKCVEPHPVGPAYFPNHDEHDVVSSQCGRDTPASLNLIWDQYKAEFKHEFHLH